MYGVINDAIAAGKQAGALRTEMSLINRDIKRLQKHLSQFEPGDSRVQLPLSISSDITLVVSLDRR